MARVRRFTERQRARLAAFVPAPIEHRRPVEGEPTPTDPGRPERVLRRVGALVRRERDAAAAEAVERAKTVAIPDAHPEAKDPLLRGTDRGPAHQRRRGRLETVDAAEAGGAIIRRARVRDPLRSMVKRGALPYRAYHAAQLWIDDLSTAATKGGAVEGLRVVMAPWGRTHLMTDKQAMAHDRAVRAWREAIGLIAGGVVSWVALSGGTLDGYAECKGIRRQRASETLTAALDRLADHYQVGDVEPPKDWC